MAEPLSFEFDYQHLNGFGGLLSPIGANPSSPNNLAAKSEDDLTLLNISSNKPQSSNANYSQNQVPNGPENIDHLLKIIESNDKQNERMIMQFRLKQVLLDYLKTKQIPQTQPQANSSVSTGNTSPSLCQQQNHCIQALDTDCQRVPTGLSEAQNPMLAGYPIRDQSPPILTPPISPDIGHQFFMTSEQKTPTNMQYINLNNVTEAVECQQLSETIENLYSSEPEEQTNNQLSIDQSVEDLDESSEDNQQIETCFDEHYDYQTVTSANCSPYSNTLQSSAKLNTSPIDVISKKKSKSNDDRNRKASTQSAPEQSAAAQKRSAHLSAEFRYRTKLNDKITRLRNIVGPKSQLSKSGVLSRSIDLISKLQKSNTKLKEENRKFRILLMQACNQLPNNAMSGSHEQNTPMFIQ